MRTFSANLAEIEKCRRKKNYEIISSVFYVVFFFGLLMIYGDNAIVWDIATDMDIEASSVESFLIFLMAGAAFMEIFSIVVAVLFSRRYKSLSGSKLVLENNDIRGVHFSSVDAQGVPFSVSYEEVERAYADGSPDALNLTIFCKNRTYRCFAIAGAHIAADQINEICRSGKTPQEASERSSRSSAVPGKNTTAIPSGMTVGLQCPRCGVGGQPSNRTCCWSCGAPFEK